MFVGVFLILLLQPAESSERKNGETNLTWEKLISKGKSETRYIVRKFLPTIGRILFEANVSSNCERGLMSLAMSLMQWKGWAIQMVDANSKIPSGLMEGTVMDFGAFEECLKIRVYEASKNVKKQKESFRGRYCNVGFQSNLLISALRGKEHQNFSDTYGIPPKETQYFIDKYEVFLKEAKLWAGLCVPSSCSKNDVFRIFEVVAKKAGLKSTVSDCQIDESFVWPVHSLIALGFMGCIVGLCTIGTTLDVMNRRKGNNSTTKEKEDLLLKTIKAFSVVKNSEILFCTNAGGKLDCLNGMRFLTASWIIFGHTYFFIDKWKYFQYRRMIGLADVLDGYFPRLMLQDFTLSVGTFFLISGFLLVYTTWKRFENNDGKLNVFMIILHKYWRMTPAVGFTIILLLIMPVIDSGPLWNSELEPEVQPCIDNWWMNLLYINNWAPIKEFCLPHTWYLSVLMQSHIVGILLLVVVYRWRVVGAMIGSLLAVICATTVAFIVLWRKYTLPVLAVLTNKEMRFDFGEYVYTKPAFHFTSFLAGMLVGYVFLKNIDRKMDMKYKVLGWFLAVSVLLFSFYGSCIATGNRTFAAFFFAVNRAGWAISIGWMIYACGSGAGGILNKLLSLRIMYPLGQLSYLIYLIHPLVLVYKSAITRERTYFGNSEQFFSFLSTLGLTIFLAYIGHVCVEIPFLILDKIFFNGQDRREKVKKTECTNNSPVFICNIKYLNPS